MNDSEPAPIMLVHSNADRRSSLAAILESGGYRVSIEPRVDEALERALDEPPGLLLLEYGPGAQELVSTIKSHNIYGHLPLMLVFSEALEKEIDWEPLSVDDYVCEPIAPAELLSRVRLCLARYHRDVNTNPLTGLPGNFTILREAERRLATKEPFALAYLDIDSFKPFNDVYGFARGDEVLRMTARIVVNTLRQFPSPEVYVGHVGGDDFVFMTPPDVVRNACERIVRSFDQIVVNFYDDEDRRRGGLVARNRKGEEEHHPLMTCSLGVVVADDSKITHIGDLPSRITQVKGHAKRLPGSNYTIDRRRG